MRAPWSSGSTIPIRRRDRGRVRALPPARVPVCAAPPRSVRPQRYVVDRRADHGALDCLIGGAINLRKIEENWNETLRITASIRAGTIAPSVLMRRLAAYSQQNALARALREIGCLERTLLFILDWISDPALRRRSNARLNKARPETRSPAPVSIVTARSGTAPSKTSATVSPASTSRSPPSSSGTPLPRPRRCRASRPSRNSAR